MATNATIYSGDSKTLEITITDSNGAPVNLAGATITYAVIKRATETRMIEKTLADGIAIGGADNNVVLVALGTADTAALAGTYQHELEIIDSSGNVSTALRGFLTIRKDYIT